MRKIRVAVFGISDGILKVIEEEINPLTVEIIIFFDNDKMKHGVCYKNIPVVEPSKQLVQEYSIDYILVTVLSGYASVKKQLTDLGIEEKKIQVFVAKDIKKYCVGALEDIDVNLINKIYFEPQKIMDIVEEYKKIFSIYSKIPAYDEDTEAWYNKGSLISHACGGVVNGRRIMYSNSKEAIEYSVRKKFKLIECDLIRLDNGELMLMHHLEQFWEWKEEQYSLMSLEELLSFIKEHSEISCLIDVKWKNHDEYSLVISEVDRHIRKIVADNDKRYVLKKQIVMEVYDEETIKVAKKNGFNMIFTQYRNPECDCFMNTVNLCYKYGIKAIALGVNESLNMAKFIKIFTDKNIKVFVFSTDSIDEYASLKRLNVTGIFTNYLTESDVS